MKPRLRECVDRWSDAFTGGYDSRCCRWPKSCSATVYDPQRVTDADLEDDRPRLLLPAHEEDEVQF